MACDTVRVGKAGAAHEARTRVGELCVLPFFSSRFFASVIEFLADEFSEDDWKLFEDPAFYKTFRHELEDELNVRASPALRDNARKRPILIIIHFTLFFFSYSWILGGTCRNDQQFTDAEGRAGGVPGNDAEKIGKEAVDRRAS